MIRKLVAILLMAGAVTAQVDESAEPSSFSLEEAQQYALVNSYSVQDKTLEYEKSVQTIKETAAIGLPQISAAFDFTYNAKLAQMPLPEEFQVPGGPKFAAFGTEYSNVASLNLDQLLLDGSYFIALQGTKVFKQIAVYDLEISELQIINDVSQAYYGVLVSKEKIEIIIENLASMQKSYNETKALYDNGFVEEQDVDQLELLISGLSNTLNRTEREYEIAKMLLNFNLGRPVRAELTLTSTVEDVMVVEDLLLNNPFDVTQNLNYKLAETKEYGSELQVKNEKWKYYPTLSGFVRHGQSNFQNDLDRTFSFHEYWIPNTSMGLSLRWNLLEGLKRPATVQKAKLDQERAEVGLALSENQLKLEYERAKTTYQFTFDNYNTQKRNVELSKKIRDKTYIKYQEGISSSLDLTQAENQYLDAQQQYILAIQNLLNAKEQLIYAIGK